MAVVTLDGVGKRYERGGSPAVEGVSLEVADGEFFVLLGPSGCGKSTTLRMVAGLEAISEGALSIDGRRMNDVPAKDRDIAMVFQSYALYPHMNVRDNLSFGLRRRSVPKAEIERRVGEVAAALGLSELLARRPHALSGGQRQRVALGRAIVREPKVFLFDEPLSNLDAALRVSTRQELARLHQRLRATMVYVTHDQVEAMTLGDRICVMQAGRVAQIGRPLDVYRRPASTFVARFLGAPPMNLLPASIEDGAAVLAGGARVEARAAARPGDVVLGVRPEEIGLGPPGEGPLGGRVQLVERLGAETVVTVALPAGEVLVRTPRDAELRAGDEVSLRVAPDAILFFDPASGAALPGPTETPR
jgi:multiple sugar transport system ATP-binding protein